MPELDKYPELNHSTQGRWCVRCLFILLDMVPEHIGKHSTQLIYTLYKRMSMIRTVLYSHLENRDDFEGTKD